MKNTMRQGMVTFPKEAILKGRTWTSTRGVKLPFGAMKIDITYTYLGPEARGSAELERIDTSSVISLEPSEGAGVAMRVKAADARGTIYFDNKEGRIVESAQTQKMVTEIVAGGGTFESTLNQTTTLKLVPPKNRLP